MNPKPEGQTEERLKAFFLEASAYPVDHPEALLELPERFGLYVLPLDEPEVLQTSLRAASGHGEEEGPVVWALMREGRVEALMAPRGPVLPVGAG